jgi:glucose-6-phosphate isomerase
MLLKLKWEANKMLEFKYDNALRFMKEEELHIMEPMVLTAHDMLHEGKGPGSNYTGWLGLPAGYDRNEYARIKSTANRIKDNSNALVIIGIGGSYLGARAALDMLSHSFYNMKASESGTPEVYFAGNNISADYISDLFEVLHGKDITINVISKSGTTTEPAIGFRLFRKYMEERYGIEEASKRIISTTDKARGSMKKLADEKGYETFVIPDDVGGRYSVLTAVGLLPMAACGIDTDAVIAGSSDGMNEYAARGLEKNPAYQYAACRNILYRKGYIAEIMANYEPSLHYFTEWWKQLYGESEGKDRKGIFPAGVDFTTDLHSMGQYIQDGLRKIFETVIWTQQPLRQQIIPGGYDEDGFSFLTGKSMSYVNSNAMIGTMQAHIDGGVPNLSISVPERSPFWFGKLVYFFEKACAISGYLLGVNPFDQPGVEEYKKNMFRLLKAEQV